MIEVDDLVFEYPTKRALHGISLRVAEGSITALVGPNGAGKTTLLRCLAALEPPYAGRVRIAGLDTQVQPREVHALIGYLPDFFGLYDDLTVRQCLFFAARAHGLEASRAEVALAKTAERVELTDRLASKAGELSRGLRQRLAVGQAIVHEPRLLLLDEPASGLDPQARRGLSELLTSLRAQGITQVVSSHILAELKDYATHMLIMDEGRITESMVLSDGHFVRIELSVPDAALAGYLGDRSDVALLRTDGRAAVVELTAEADRSQARAALLRALVDQGFAVSSVTDISSDLEQAYFARLPAKAGADAGGSPR